MKTLHLPLLAIMIVSASVSSLAHAKTSPTVVQFDEHCRSIVGAVVDGGNGSQLRVREGSALTATGKNQKIYVDRGGAVTVTGSGAEVFVESGAAVTLTGDGSKVYREKDASLTSTGSNSDAVVSGFKVRISDRDQQCRKL
jgi:hypothetical protein